MEKMKSSRACPSSSSALTEERIRQFCTSLESKTNAPLFTIVMRNNDCKPLPQSKLKIATTATTSATSTAATTTVMNSASATSPTAEETMWGKPKVTSEQAAQIERNRGQANSTIWYQEHKIRVTASFFGCVCRRLPNTSSHALVNSIINQKMYRSMPIACAWGKNNENKASMIINQNYKNMVRKSQNLDLLLTPIKYSLALVQKVPCLILSPQMPMDN